MSAEVNHQLRLIHTNTERGPTLTESVAGVFLLYTPSRNRLAGETEPVV